MKYKQLVLGALSMVVVFSIMGMTPPIFATLTKWFNPGSSTGSTTKTVSQVNPLPVVASGVVADAADSGQVTCANTATQLTSKVCIAADIVALSANTEDVFLKVGNTVTTANGSALPAGAGYSWGIDANLNTLYCISASGGQLISYTCLVD